MKISHCVTYVETGGVSTLTDIHHLSRSDLIGKTGFMVFTVEDDTFYLPYEDVLLLTTIDTDFMLWIPDTSVLLVDRPHYDLVRHLNGVHFTPYASRRGDDAYLEFNGTTRNPNERLIPIVGGLCFHSKMGTYGITLKSAWAHLIKQQYNISYMVVPQSISRTLYPSQYEIILGTPASTEIYIKLRNGNEQTHLLIIAGICLTEGSAGVKRIDDDTYRIDLMVAGLWHQYTHRDDQLNLPLYDEPDDLWVTALMNLDNTFFISIKGECIIEHSVKLNTIDNIAELENDYQSLVLGLENTPLNYTRVCHSKKTEIHIDDTELALLRWRNISENMISPKLPFEKLNSHIKLRSIFVKTH